MENNRIQSIDFVLDQIVGEDGLWQVKLFSIVLAAEMCNIVNLILPTLTAFTPSHRCYIPSCDNHSDDGIRFLHEEWMEFAIPKTINGKEFLKAESKYDQCHMFEYNYYSHNNATYNDDGVDDKCIESSFGRNVTSCNKFVYDHG